MDGIEEIHLTEDGVILKTLSGKLGVTVKSMYGPVHMGDDEVVYTAESKRLHDHYASRVVDAFDGADEEEIGNILAEAVENSTILPTHLYKLVIHKLTREYTPVVILRGVFSDA